MTEREIFETALDFEGPSERAAYLSDACGNDETLRMRVESLLRSHEKAASFLNTPVVEQIVGEGKRIDFLAPSQRPESLGRLGHYEVLEVVGRGGMGIVFRAFDTKLHRHVAIKVLAPQLSTSATARQRFVREAQAAAAVSHEHIVAIHAVEDGGSVPYLVMQFVDGSTLQKKLERTGQLPASDILRIAFQIAEGLSAAHGHGLVHRDIKPANILLEAGGERVKITDFGLARAVDDVSVTQSGVIAGTPMYMSPEQADGQAVDFRSDQFSLGSVLYAMCTGQPPFRAPSALSILKRVCEETAKPIHEINAELPQWLGDLVARLHAKSPADRFDSTQEVTEILGRGLRETTIGGSSSSTIVVKSVGHSKSNGPSRLRSLLPGGLLLAVGGGLILTEAAGITNLRGAFRRGPAATPTASDDATWEREVSALPAAQQVHAIADRLKLLNPNFDGKIVPIMAGDDLTGLRFSTDQVMNILPVRAIAHLSLLDVGGKSGKLADLSPLRGMKLAQLSCNHTRVSDLSPLQGMPLVSLNCSATDVSSLNPLKGMPLRSLHCSCRRVSELSPLSGMNLQRLDVAGSNVTDLSPLQGMPLVELNAFGASQLRSIAYLNGLSLEILNIGATRVTDLSPLRDMTSLRTLIIDDAAISDLSPLKNLRLETLRMARTRVADLSPIKDLPLKQLWLDLSSDSRRDFIQSIPGLESINGIPAAEFWKTHGKHK